MRFGVGLGALGRLFAALAVAIFAVLLGALAARADMGGQKRVALVIGNGAYLYAPKLDNPIVDAKAFAASLRRLGFQVTEGYDLTSAQMRTTVAEFAKALPDSQAALVFYAGHGVSLDEENYLLPTDIQLKSPTDLDLNAISVSLVLRQMRREERVNIVVLDACRDNPFAADLARAKTRAVVGERGLSRVEGELARGALIAFASDPKSVALDGRPGEHSPFTKALLDHIEDPGVSIDTVMSRVRSEVWDETKNRQLPWVNTSIIGEFELNPAIPNKEPASAAVAIPAAATAAPDRRTEENLLWDSAQRSNLPADYQAYLDVYPAGFFAAMARNRIAALGPQATPRSGPAGGEAPPLTVQSEVGAEETERALGLDLAARKELQQRLLVLGLDVGLADGEFGEKTRIAIGEWQKRHGAAPSGYVGPLQYAALKSESEPLYRRFLAAVAPTQAPTPARPPVRAAPTSTAQKAPTRVYRLGGAAAKDASKGQKSLTNSQPAATPETAAPPPTFAPEVFQGLRALSDSLNATVPKSGLPAN